MGKKETKVKVIPSENSALNNEAITEEKIRERAFYIYLHSSDRSHDQTLENWLRAEKELRSVKK